MELTQRWHLNIGRDRLLNGAIALAVIGLAFSLAMVTRGQEFSNPVTSVPQLSEAETAKISIPPTYKKRALLKTNTTPDAANAKKAVRPQAVTASSVTSAPQSETAHKERSQLPKKSIKNSKTGLRGTVVELVNLLR